MDQKLSKIFKEMKQIEPNKELEASILQKIGLERNRQIKRKLVISYVGIVVSFVAIFPAVLKFGVAFFNSEFWSILSLAFSDFMAVAGNWNEYLYSLGETLPIINIIAVLIPILGVLMFLNFYFSIRGKIKNINHTSLNLKSI